MGASAYSRNRRLRKRRRLLLVGVVPVVLLLLLSLLFLRGCGGSDAAELDSQIGDGVPGPAEEQDAGEEPEAGGESTGAAQNGGDRESTEAGSGERPDTLAPGVQDRTGGPLVDHRLVSYYGHPFSDQMGVLGELGPEQLVESLQQRADSYTEADPSLPAIPTIELIASVAQPEPTDQGDYLIRTPPEVIEEYADLAEENDFLLLLDVQIGYSTVAEEVEAIMPFLERPYVHLAIDPEWDMSPGQIPGQEIGSTDAAEIMAAAQTLSELVEREDLPPKVLVAHQFEPFMIERKELLGPVENVQMVVHADGFGLPEGKFGKYDALVRDEPVQYGGFKLFYQQDIPLLNPRQVLQLDPPPAVVSYQ